MSKSNAIAPKKNLSKKPEKSKGGCCKKNNKPKPNKKDSKTKGGCCKKNPNKKDNKKSKSKGGCCKKNKKPDKKKSKTKGGCCRCCCCCKKKKEPSKNDDNSKKKGGCCNPICVVSWIIFIIGLSLLLDLSLSETQCNKMKLDEFHSRVAYRNIGILLTYSFLSMVLLCCLLFIVLTKCNASCKCCIWTANILLIMHIIIGASVGGTLYAIYREYWIKPEKECLYYCMVYSLIMLVLGVIPYVVFYVGYQKKTPRETNPEKIAYSEKTFMELKKKYPALTHSRIATSSPHLEMIKAREFSRRRSESISTSMYRPNTASSVDYNFNRTMSARYSYNSDIVTNTSRQRSTSRYSRYGSSDLNDGNSVFINIVSLRSPF